MGKAKGSKRYIKFTDRVTGEVKFFKTAKYTDKFSHETTAVLTEINIATLKRVEPHNNVYSYPSFTPLNYRLSDVLKAGNYTEMFERDLMNPYELEVGTRFELLGKSKEAGAIYEFKKVGRSRFELAIVHSPSGYKKPIEVSRTEQGLISILTEYLGAKVLAKV